MTDPLSLEQRRAVLAADFALGLLEESEQVEASRLFETDPLFAQEVTRWDAEIDAWRADVSDRADMSDAVWRRIAASITPAAVSPAPADSVLRNDGGWRITALAASVATVVFASLWLTAQNQPGMAPPTSDRPVALNGLSVAQIQGNSEQRLVSAVYDRASGQLLARLSPLPSREGVPALWLIGNDGKPRSLGVGRSGGVISITLSPDLRDMFADGATIAISMEPTATTHGVPEGPILGTATISAM